MSLPISNSDYRLLLDEDSEKQAVGAEVDATEGRNVSPSVITVAKMSTHHRNLQLTWSNRAMNLLLCAGGIMLFYGAFSVFQEKM